MEKLFLVPVGCSKHLTVAASSTTDAINKAELILWNNFDFDPIIAIAVKQISNLSKESSNDELNRF